jgi:ABC-type transport system involved in multi-copper enzyme maturation permease subunit
MKEYLIYSLSGWVGIILIIIGYLLLSNKKLKKNYVLYHLINLFGAAGIFISTFFTKSWPAATLSLIFAGISIFYIVKILGTKAEYKEFR